MNKMGAVLGGCLLVAVGGCKKSHAKHNASGPKPSASAAAGPAPVKMGGTISVKDEYMGTGTAKIGVAYAYISGTKTEPKVELDLYDARRKDIKSCDDEILDFGASTKVGEYSLKLEGTLDHMPTASHPAKATDVGYSIYYRHKGDKKGTNSGDTRDSTIVITQLDNHVVKGTYQQGKTITSSFTAKVCSNDLAADGGAP